MRKYFFLLFGLLIFISCTTKNPNVEFVDLEKINPEIVFDIRYATENNFLKKAVYPAPRCFARTPVAIKIDSIQKDLSRLGLGLKIFDGYRPLSVQKMMWEILPDDRYVANPKYGSRHNRGVAIDISLVDSNGIELQMPTDFDDFSEKASHSFMDLSEEQKKNRKTLKDIMEKYGFVSLESEWWHYDLKNYIDYPVVDFSFDEIEQQFNKQTKIESRDP